MVRVTWKGLALRSRWLITMKVLLRMLTRFSELSDDDLDDEMLSDDEQDKMLGQPGLSVEDQEDRVRNLVPGLPSDEWGRKPGATKIVTGPDQQSRMSTSQTKKQATIEHPPPQMRPPIFVKQDFDGVISDSDEDSEDDVLPPPGTLGRKIAEMKWADGAPKFEEIDDEPSRQKKLGLGDDIDKQMERRVWGGEAQRDGGDEMEIDPDMGEEEEEFLRFSREALGISDDTWEGILNERRERGGEWAVQLQN